MKSVMIVDDSLELGRLLQASLMVLDPTLKVVVVPSAEEAILESSRSPLDLLVTDIRLPGISGMELVRKIRARRPVVKIMLITGLSDVHLDQQVKELAVDAFFRKPLEIPEFLEAARACLGLSADALQKTEKAEPESKPKKKKQEQEQEEKADSQIEAQAQMAADLLDVLPEAVAVKTLSNILTDLRHELGALATLVLDERGHLIAQAGETPDDGLTEKMTLAWMAVHTPSLTLGALLKPGLPHSVQAFRGAQVDFLFAPVGGYSVGVVLRQGKSALRLALAFEAVLQSLDELGDVLGVNSIALAPAMQPQLGLEDSQAAMPAFVDEEVVTLEEPPAAEFLSALQGQADADADSFWDNSDAPAAVVSTPDMLTYDQALQLGLAPEEE